MAAELELLTIGRISVDLYCGEPGAGWTEAQTFNRAVGGSPTNVAIAAARFARRTAVYTKVGGDPFGEMALEELRQFGVETRFVGVVPTLLTPLAFAVLEPPEEPSLLFRREPPVPDIQLHAGEISPETIAGIRILWVSGGALSEDPSRSTVQSLLAQRAGARHTVLDLDYRPTFWGARQEATEVIGAAIEQATVAVGNREECAVATGHSDSRRAASALLERGVELAIVKLGGDGVLAASAEGRRLLPPAPVQVVCGLGAGDAFGGALCHGLLSGWTPERVVQFANAAGAIVASRLLCSQAMPYEQEVLELMGAPAA